MLMKAIKMLNLSSIAKAMFGVKRPDTPVAKPVAVRRKRHYKGAKKRRLRNKMASQSRRINRKK